MNNNIPNNNNNNNNLSESEQKAKDEYYPSLLIFPAFNYINIPLKQRRLITQKYGNKHDKYLLKLHEKSLKYQYKQQQNRHKYKQHKGGQRNKRFFG